MNKSVDLWRHVEIIKTKDIENWKRSVLIISIGTAPASDWSILSVDSLITTIKATDHLTQKWGALSKQGHFFFFFLPDKWVEGSADSLWNVLSISVDSSSRQSDVESLKRLARAQ